ncbi:MAG: AAA family ATPase [Desulfuromonadales bacterium]|nr:AAA family ATPase [Desulfuromonadales bacterium]
MYESFFNFKQKPFDLLPDPQFLYMSNTHRRAMNYLQYGFDERAGFILLTGDIGSGKTTLLRALMNRLDDRAVISRVFNTQIDPSQLLGLINMDFGLAVTRLDKVKLIKDLNDFLIGCYTRKEKPLLIIDEAQNLSNETLEEIRLLSNLESGSEKLLQIIMVGQPELQAILNQKALTQLRQRLSVSCHLERLTLEETSNYFYHRLECAGNRAAITLPEGAFEQIDKLCNGVPRLINILGDYLLLAAFSDQITEISDSFLHELVEELRSSVAFAKHDKSAPARQVVALSLHDQKSWELLQQIQKKQQRYEEILKKITRKQIVQIDTIRDQLVGITATLKTIEHRFMEQVQTKSGHKSPFRNSSKQVLTKMK